MKIKILNLIRWRRILPRALTVAGIFSAFSIFVLPVALAAIPNFYEPDASAAEKQSQVALNNLSAVSLMATNVRIDTIPSAGNGSFATGSTTVTVTTNSPTGYTLTMNAEDDTSLEYSLGKNSAANIPSIVDDKTGSEMLTDAGSSWGFIGKSDDTNFSLSGSQGNSTDLGLTFHPIPAVSSPSTIADTSSNTGDNCTSGSCTETIGFGVKVAADSLPGTYSRSILFTAVAKASTAPVTSGTMQGWTGCADLAMSTASDDHTITLTGSRDNNTYTVAKLADGQCWMTQNLLLGDSKLTNRTLTSDNTNLPSGETFNLPASNAAGFDAYDKVNVYSTDQCNDSDTHADDTTPCGGYYTWLAITAGWGTTSRTSGISPKDICPKGWRLPRNTEFNSSTGLTKFYTSNTALTDFPVNMKYAGRYYDLASYPDVVGKDSYYWSANASSSSLAYDLLFDTGGRWFDGSDTRNKGLGIPGRCVYDKPYYSYSLAFHSNGGVGNIQTQSDVSDSETKTYTIPYIAPTKRGDNFKGWATTSTATVAEYQPGDTVTLGSATPTMTLYAVWDSQINACPSGTVELTEGTCWKTTDETAGTDKNSGKDYRLYTWRAATSRCAALATETGLSFRLPTLSEMDVLITKYPSGNVLILDPVNMRKGGDYEESNNSYGNYASRGYYWASTEHGSSQAYYISFGTTDVGKSYDEKIAGCSARCVVDK